MFFLKNCTSLLFYIIWCTFMNNFLHLLFFGLILAYIPWWALQWTYTILSFSVVLYCKVMCFKDSSFYYLTAINTVPVVRGDFNPVLDLWNLQQFILDDFTNTVTHINLLRVNIFWGVFRFVLYRRGESVFCVQLFSMSLSRSECNCSQVGTTINNLIDTGIGCCCIQ